MSIFFVGYRSLGIAEHKGPQHRRDSFTHTLPCHFRHLLLATCPSISHSHYYAGLLASSFPSSLLVPYLQVSRKARWHRTKPSIRSHHLNLHSRSDGSSQLENVSCHVGTIILWHAQPVHTACPNSCEAYHVRMESWVGHQARAGLHRVH